MPGDRQGQSDFVGEALALARPDMVAKGANGVGLLTDDPKAAAGGAQIVADPSQPKPMTMLGTSPVLLSRRSVCGGRRRRLALNLRDLHVPMPHGHDYRWSSGEVHQLPRPENSRLGVEINRATRRARTP